MRKPVCMGCNGERKKRQYLCDDCWWLLRPWVRSSLRKKDDLAMQRLRELFRQIGQARPLEDVEVSP